MKYQAAMFDFDGTVTPDGVSKPTREMVDVLVRLAHEMPIAFCTGRDLESFEQRAMSEVLVEVAKDSRFLNNFYLIAENGSVGYDYIEGDGFVEFYRTEWPSEFIERDKLMNLLNEAVKPFGSVCFDAHKVVVVMRTHLTAPERDGSDKIEINRLSRKIYNIVLSFLEKLDPHYENHVHVGDSGIGVVIAPADGDKDNGIVRFGEFLAKNRGIPFSDKFREILVVGDRPEKVGNDHYFLNGTYGTPFTVGSLVEQSQYPKPVLGADGKRLLHDSGTIHLIKSIL